MARLSAGPEVMVGCGHRGDSSFEICAWSVRKCGTGGSLAAPGGLVAGDVFGSRSGQRGRRITRGLVEGVDWLSWAQRVVTFWLVLDVVGLPGPRWIFSLGIAEQAKPQPPPEDWGGVYLTKER